MTSEVKALKVIADVCRSMFDAERIFAGGPLAGIPGQEWVFFDYLGLQYVIKGYGETAVVRALQTVKGGQPLSKCAEVSRPGYLFYCVSGSMSKQERFHKRSVKSIVDEMEFLQKTYHVNDVIFYDDCFFFKVSSTNQEIKNFRDELFRRDIHMSWQMEIRVDWLTHIDSNGVHMLEECGCRQINVGIEKTNPLGQEYLGKAFSVGAFVDAVRLVKRHSKIRIAGTFILGGGDENQERIMNRCIQRSWARFRPLQSALYLSWH